MLKMLVLKRSGEDLKLYSKWDAIFNLIEHPKKFEIF